MVSSTRQAAAGIFVLLVSALLAYSQTTSPKEPGATITGKITIKDKPAAGVVVGLRTNDRMRQQESTNYRAVTNVDGEYRLTNVAPGNYQVIAVAPAFVLDENNNRALIINKDETVEHIDFALVPGGVITGKVVDQDGRPLIEQAVSIMPLKIKSRFYYTPNVQTDDRGVYRAFGLAAGTYQVAVGRDGDGSFGGRGHVSYKRTFYPGVIDPAQATAVEVSEGGETTNIDITMSRPLTTYAAKGRIIDAETGQPLPNISYGITWFVNEGSTSSWEPGRVSTARGEFVFDDLSPGKYAVRLRPKSGNEWRAESLPFEIIDQDVTNLVMKVRRGGSIAGVVVLEGTDDKAARDQVATSSVGASVPNDDVRSFGFLGRIAPDGSFRIDGLPPGFVHLYWASEPRFRVVRVEYNGIVDSRGIELKNGQHISGVRVILNYGNASIRGVVEVENGTAPANGRLFVNLRSTEEEDPRFRAYYDSQIDARGRFLIDGLFPGTYTLEAGIYIPGPQPTAIRKTEQVVVSAGTSNTVNIKVDLSAAPVKP